MFSQQYPTLTRHNYIAWAMRTKVMMRAEGVWGAIQQHDGRMALAIIYQGIPDEAVLSLVGKDTAREAWQALERMYLGDDRAKETKVRTLKTELEVLQMKESESICDLAWKVRRILGTIRFLGGEVDETSVVTNILMAVPSRFKDTVAVIDRAGRMTVEEVIGRLQVHEEIIRRRLLISARCMAAQASQGHGNAEKSKINCHCGFYGHHQSECWIKKHSG
jgi:hypothetical protein